MWLLGISPSYSVSIVSADYPLDKVADWLPLVRLRKFAPPSRVYYDLQPQNEREIFQLEIKDLEWGAMMKPTRFHRADWRVVQFLNPDALLSTIITSDRGLAFVGWPTAFLVSERSATTGQGQTVSGTVLFVPKRHWMENPTEPITGLSFFLLNRIDDITSPLLRDGIHLFIGFDGTIAIQNRQKHKGLYRSSGFYSQSYAKVARHDCYAFNIVMELTSVSLTIYPSRDCTGANETLPTIGVYRQISLSLPLQASQPAFVLAQKSGDANMDLIVENLQHHSGSGVVGVSLALLLIVMLFSFNTFELSHSL